MLTLRKLLKWKEVAIAIRSKISKKLKIKDVLLQMVVVIYPCLSKLVCALLVLPVHKAAADCERGLSALRRNNHSRLTNRAVPELIIAQKS